MLKTVAFVKKPSWKDFSRNGAKTQKGGASLETDPSWRLCAFA